MECLPIIKFAVSGCLEDSICLKTNSVMYNAFTGIFIYGRWHVVRMHADRLLPPGRTRRLNRLIFSWAERLRFRSTISRAPPHACSALMVANSQLTAWDGLKNVPAALIDSTGPARSQRSWIRWPPIFLQETFDCFWGGKQRGIGVSHPCSFLLPNQWVLITS